MALVAFCPKCEKEVEVRYEDPSFDYAGTHCTFGKSGTCHLPGEYECRECDSAIETSEVREEWLMRLNHAKV